MCVDINECENEDMCMYGRCVNKPGGYECICDEEHQLIPTGTGCVGLYSFSCFIRYYIVSQN